MGIGIDLKVLHLERIESRREFIKYIISESKYVKEDFTEEVLKVLMEKFPEDFI